MVISGKRAAPGVHLGRRRRPRPDRQRYRPRNVRRFGSKLAAERIVSDSGLPWTTLRATQFNDLLYMVAEQIAKLPVIPFPAGFRFQPVDADEVAARLVEITPAGLVRDVGWPRVYGVADLLRNYLQARTQRA